MSLEKDYKYFKTDQATKERLCDFYKKEIAGKREALFKDLFSSTGAIACEEQQLNSSYICGLVFPADHEHTNNPNLICKRAKFNEQDVISVVGKKNRHEGKEFNKIISNFNSKASEYLNFIDWIYKELGIRHETTVPSRKRDFGFTLISTYGGVAGDVLAFAIPAKDIETLSFHESLQEITYGQFYDLMESTSSEI